MMAQMLVTIILIMIIIMGFILLLTVLLHAFDGKNVSNHSEEGVIPQSRNNITSKKENTLKQAVNKEVNF